MSYFGDARQRLINFINYDKETSAVTRPVDAIKEDLVYNLITQEPHMAQRFRLASFIGQENGGAVSARAKRREFR